MGTVTELCCTTTQVNNMAKQFMAKLTYGLASLTVSFIINGGASATATASFIHSCEFKTGYKLDNLTSELVTKANRSFNGLLYGTAKMAVAALPFVQTEVCLACASD